MTLKSFPRGGRKPQQNLHTNNEFKKKSRSKPRAQKNAFTSSDYEKSQISNLVSKTADCLTYNTLTQGMVVLGRVREAREYDLIISLPGRLVGRLLLTDISESYTNLLQSMINTQDVKPEGYKPLPQLFKSGDYIVCYVKQLNPEEKWNISLSLEPELINQNLDRTRIIERSKIIGSISSIEEHGYVIDTGVANLRTFLASKQIDEGKQYFIGQQLFLVVKEVKTSESASTITVSAKTKHNTKATAHDAQLLDALVPGTKLILTITNVLSSGLQVLFNGSNIGYINQIYLNNPLSSYTIDRTVHGTLLYVLPTVKFGYFSLLSEERETESLDIGDIVTAATVLCKEQKGILLKLPKGLRGFIPMRRTEVDFEKINSTFSPDTKHECRILNYDWFDRVYICTMQKQILNQKHFTLSSFVPGELVTAKITSVDLEYGSVHVKINTSQGYVPPEHVSDIGTNLLNKLKIGQSVKVRVLRTDKDRNRLVLTMKKSLIESNLPILSDINETSVGSQHHGTIVQIKNTGILIQFFGDLKGWVAPHFLGCDITNIKNIFCYGQVVTASILKINKKDNKIHLSLTTMNKTAKTKLRVGETVEGIVIESSPQGLQVNIVIADEDTDETAFLPAGHMAPSLEVASLLAARYTPGDKITATVFSTKPTLTLTTTFMPCDEFADFKKLAAGQYLPCSVKEITENGLKVLLPINNYDKLGIVPYIKKSDSELLFINQMLFGKIICINNKGKTIELTTDLYELWLDSVKQKTEMTNAVDTLGLYLKTVSDLSKHHYYKSRPVSEVSLGEEVAGTIAKVTEHGLILNLDNDLQGTVRKDHYTKDLKAGDKVTGKIIWINYVHEIVELTLKPAVMKRIATEQSSSDSPTIGPLLRGEIILITNWVVLIVLKGQGKGRLAALPARRHLNDVQPNLEPYIIGNKVKCHVVLGSDEGSLLPICVLSSMFEGRNLALISKPKKSSQKRKTEVGSEEHPPPKKSKLEKKSSKSIESTDDQKDLTNNTNSHDNRKTRDIESVNEPKKKKSKKLKTKTTDDEAVQKTSEDLVDKNEVMDIGIPECGFYWDTQPTQQETPVTESSSDSEDETSSPQKQKKKKLTAAERREQERQKEREIREREEALASNQLPNSVDQFDRLVMSSPNSSVVWIQYMAYHLQATEIEKARAVAKRAIKTINFREDNERLNVWQAWLNLESRFGTLETLNEVFQEAIRTNDAFKVYTHMLTLHADANRQSALEKTITTITGKFKQNPQAWIECGAALLKIGLKDKSRHIMQRALQSLPTHQHVDLMVRFAQLENKYGDKERGQTLFEKVLSSYPKRVDVWSAYVDTLIKSGDVPIARHVLERATAQTLPARKMKTIFKKFIAFEEQYGTADNVASVQEMARNYVENQCQQ